MVFQIEDLDKNHPARLWKNQGDTFGFVKNLEELINLLRDNDLIYGSKLREFERDKHMGRFFGFLFELRAMTFFFTCGVNPRLNGRHVFPDITLRDESIDVEVKACTEESTGNEVLYLGRKLTEDELVSYKEKGIRKFLDVIEIKGSKIKEFKPFILFINTMCGGLEMHINDIKKPLENAFKKYPKISAIIIDDRYNLDGKKFSFAVFLNNKSKNPLPKDFLEKMQASKNPIRW